MKLTAADERRFWAKVQITDGCWEWQGGRPGNYGHFWLRDRLERAHRVAFELENGPIPDGLWVLHHCDNRPCVRPDHLFLGTSADNMLDASSKGRLVGRPAARGERVASSKLTPALVREIRGRLADGASVNSLAPKYGVTRRTIDFIRDGVTWRHVA